MRILHLSDTHVTRMPGPNRYGVDPRESLRRMLHDCGEVTDVDVLVITGDLADDGSRDAYRDFLGLAGDFARQRRIPAVFTTGNHDERAAFTEVLGYGHRDAGGNERSEARLESADGERAAVTTVGGYRLISLDSLVPGKGYGLISAAQLAWLRDVLAEPAPNGSVLAFHHPPVMVPGVAVQRALGLRNGADLAGVISGTDVRAVLCGHFHLQILGMLDAVPVWVTPGVVNRVDLTARAGTERAAKGASASLIDLGGPHSPLFHTMHARDPQVGDTAYEADEAELAAVIAELGPGE
jgi:Icc protein